MEPTFKKIFGTLVVLLSLVSANTFSQSLDYTNVYEVTISSKHDYEMVRDTVEDLAIRIHKAGKAHANLSYSFNYTDAGKLASVTLSGVAGQQAEELAFYITKLEILGQALRTMDLQYYPQISVEEQSLSEKEALLYVPEEKPLTIAYGQFLTRK